MFRSLRSIAILSAISMLAACASVPRSAPSIAAPPDVWSERRALLQTVARFDLSGRIAVAIGDEGYSATLRWRQSRHDSSVELDGPLGVGGLRLRLEGERLALRGAGGGELGGERARIELERRLGASVPLGSLRYWLLGVPDPAVPAAEQPTADGRSIAGFEQAGWRVTITRYAPWESSAWVLPQRLELAREGGAVRLRLLVDRWREFRP